MNIESGEIYFVREVDPHTKKFTNFVKIGLVHASEERDSLTRLKDHQTGNPRSLELPDGNYFKVPAVSAVEAMMHKFYAQLRISGEWFDFPNEQAIEKAKAKAKNLSGEVALFIPVFEAAQKLSNTPSNDQVADPSDRATQLLAKLSVAHAKLNILKALDKALESRFKSADEAGVNLEGLVTKGTRKQPTKFPWEKLKDKYPEIYRELHKSESRVTGSFSPKYLNVKALTLGAEFEDFAKELENLITTTADTNLAALNMPKLDLIYEMSLLDWEVTLTKAELMVECGLSAALQKICTWERKRVTVESFDLTLLKKKYPEIHKELAEPGVSKPTIRATKKKRI